METEISVLHYIMFLLEMGNMGVILYSYIHTLWYSHTLQING